MNNYCRNCGNKLMENSKFCEKCGTKVSNKRLGEVDKTKEKKYIIIFLCSIALEIAFIFSIFIDIFDSINENLASLLYGIFSLLPFAIIVFIICAKAQLKYSKFFNIVFWIMITLFILFLITIIFSTISCLYTF